jgi:4a-hydroxytetrahydrobiopterin dehydratase
MSVSDLAHKKCKSCEGGVAPLKPTEIEVLLRELEGWEYTGAVIVKTYSFKNYYQTLAFVNATAWISHRENHHPDIELSYDRCRIAYSTHAIAGLSENDFICAAKLDRLFEM